MKEPETGELYTLAQGLMDVFVSRPDTFAIQTENGSYYRVNEALTTKQIVLHLKGDITLAVYVLDQESRAKFTVIDTDDEENFARLTDINKGFYLPSYLEASRRGGHLWFFFQEPLDGRVARNFGMELAKIFRVEGEVFPKQAHSEGPGSCIRLPFGVHRKTGERYPFIGLGTWAQQVDNLAHPKTIGLAEAMKYQYQERVFSKTLPAYPPDAPESELPLWERVKRRISVRELVEQYVDLNDKGMGRCPFHDDRVPSFSVNEAENYWHCFAGCGGGSVIDFWMKLHDMTFREAVYDLAERLGIV